MSLIAPSYEMPGRTYFTEYIEKMYSTLSQELEVKLKDAEHFSLTSDLWTNPKNEPFATITCHCVMNYKLCDFVLSTRALGDIAHTGDNLNSLFRGTIARWCLDDKIVAMVVDNASNISNAVRYSGNVLLNCSAHTLQLCIKDGFADATSLKSVLDKCMFFVCKK